MISSQLEKYWASSLRDREPPPCERNDRFPTRISRACAVVTVVLAVEPAVDILPGTVFAARFLLCDEFPSETAAVAVCFDDMDG
jgi:hypothetical protein